MKFLGETETSPGFTEGTSRSATGGIMFRNFATHPPRRGVFIFIESPDPTVSMLSLKVVAVAPSVMSVI